MKKDNLEAISPLSPMQEGMLFHSLDVPQSETYFEQYTYILVWGPVGDVVVKNGSPIILEI
jgi:hypothetical protein